jgi:transcriptional regulator with XRE-family HTH domain
MNSRVTKEDINYDCNSAFPSILRGLLERGKICQKELAEYIGVSRQTVAQWKDGHTKPDIYYLSKIADFFNVSADYLLRRTEVKSLDTEIQSVCKYIKLSQESVEFLHSCEPGKFYNKNGEQIALSPEFDDDVNPSDDISYSFVINRVLTNPNFLEFLNKMVCVIRNKRAIKRNRVYTIRTKKPLYTTTKNQELDSVDLSAALAAGDIDVVGRMLTANEFAVFYGFMAQQALANVIEDMKQEAEAVYQQRVRERKGRAEK